MTDTICLFENDACAQKVGFLAMGEDWVYHNILGLSPKTLTAGPVFLQKLSVEILNEQRATIQINPMESSAKSTLTLGSKDGISDKVVGKWYSHQLKENQNGAFVLEVETIALAKDRKVNKELTVRSIDALLGSKLNDLLFISGDQLQLYVNWETEMKKIDGITCERWGQAPQRYGRCSYSEATNEQGCERLWSQMQDIVFVIDNIVYVVPPKGQTAVEGEAKCRPAIYFEEQLTVTMLGQKFLETFVTSYDYTNGQIEFGLNVHAHLGSTLVNRADGSSEEVAQTEPPEEEPSSITDPSEPIQPIEPIAPISVDPETGDP